MNKLNFRIIIFVLMNLFLVSANYSQNYVTTYAGTGSPGFVNGDTSVASFNRPFGICIDQEGNLYLADAYNHCIRKISSDGMVSTYAGSGTAGYLDGPASEAKFNQPINICLDEEGNMYVSDFLNQRIRKVSQDMMVTTIAGSGIAGLQDGLAAEAKFNYPRGICLDDTGNIYIGDSWNHRVRKISLDGMVSTWAGGGTTIGVQSVGGYVDASDTAARFYTPCELSIDLSNNIFVADAYNHRIRKIDADRMVTTIAGSGTSGPDAGGFMNGPGEQALFKVPTACHVSLTGSIYVGDGQNQRVRKISPDGMVTTFAGSGETGFENGSDSIATFDFPRGCVMDYEEQRLYVVDYNNHAIRIIHLSEITGFKEIIPEMDFEIYPNPSGNIIQIRGLNDQFNLTIQIFNASGQVVKEESGFQELPIVLNISDLKVGIYYVSIRDNERFLTVQKLVIVRN
jgi:DNA-binding beta-propeller fold protein YncE